MKYTVVIRRDNWLLDILDDEEAEMYIANPDTDFANVQEAAIAAKKEAAKADLGDVRSILRDRGQDLVEKRIDTDHYQVYYVFEGQPKVAVHGPRDLQVLNINSEFEG